MKRLALIAIAAVAATPVLAQQVDVKKAVSCQTLSQQFGDAVKTAEAEEQVLTQASDLAKQGSKACTAQDYDPGMEQIRQAIQQIGLKPVR
jgi:uncharacterized protein YdeI (BOF family)